MPTLALPRGTLRGREAPRLIGEKWCGWMLVECRPLPTRPRYGDLARTFGCRLHGLGDDQGDFPRDDRRSACPADENDATAASVIDFLRSEGAGDLGHAGARTLLGHLVSSYGGQSQAMGAIDRHRARCARPQCLRPPCRPRPLLPLTRRHELVALVGEHAERLAYDSR